VPASARRAPASSICEDKGGHTSGQSNDGRRIGAAAGASLAGSEHCSAGGLRQGTKRDRDDVNCLIRQLLRERRGKCTTLPLHCECALTDELALPNNEEMSSNTRPSLTSPWTMRAYVAAASFACRQRSAKHNAVRWTPRVTGNLKRRVSAKHRVAHRAKAILRKCEQVGVVVRLSHVVGTQILEPRTAAVVVQRQLSEHGIRILQDTKHNVAGLLCQNESVGCGSIFVRSHGMC